MIIRGKGILLAAGVLGSIFAGAMPALAQHGGGGGGHGGGGGGHAAGVHGGGAAHFSGGGHYAGGGRAYGGGAAYHGGAAFHGGFQGRAGYGYPGHFAYGRGYSTGAYWRGGYWNGGFWPRAYYGLGFSWFLPILPLAYSTYWWGGVPYYYANDVYYTYDPNYQGYIATDPPPAADPNASGAAPSDSSAPPAGAPQEDASQAGPQGGPNGPIDGAPPQIFMYPKNGQSAEQTATDRTECQKWASDQAGSVAQNGANYNRAMAACVEGRGYSAR